jgi:hypothetical protein
VLVACGAFTVRQEHGASERRVEDIDRRLTRLRALAGALAVAAAMAAWAALA